MSGKYADACRRYLPHDECYRRNIRIVLRQGSRSGSTIFERQAGIEI